MYRRLLVPLCCALLFSTVGLPGQSTFPATTMQTFVSGGPMGAPPSKGILSLSKTGVSFESKDFVFDIPVGEIQSVEHLGTRPNFMTLVLDPHSKFLDGYHSLLIERFNSIHEREELLVFALDPAENLAQDVAVASSFETYVKSRRLEREQAIVGTAALDPATAAAHPSLGRTVHAAIHEIPGLLTFFPDRVQFDSPDVRLVFPLSQIVQIEAAGTRETFFSLGLGRNSKLANVYGKYQRCCAGTGFFEFMLAPDESVASALRTAQDFQQYALAYRTSREQALVNGAQKTLENAPASTPQKPTDRKELGRYEAGFLERHNPSSKLLNSFKVITGIPGTAIVFNDGFGYVSSKQNPALKQQREAFLQDGYLKFLVPSKAILATRDVSVVEMNGGNGRGNTYVCEIDIDKNSDFFERHKALMAESDQDNRIFLTFRDRSSLSEFLRQTPHNTSARDAF